MDDPGDTSEAHVKRKVSRRLFVDDMNVDTAGWVQVAWLLEDNDFGSQAAVKPALESGVEKYNLHLPLRPSAFLFTTCFQNWDQSSQGVSSFHDQI